MDRCVPVRGYACRNAGNYDKGLFDVVRILCKLLFDGLCLSCFFFVFDCFTELLSLAFFQQTFSIAVRSIAGFVLTE